MSANGLKGLWLLVPAGGLLLASAILPGRAADGAASIFAGGRYVLPEGSRPVACRVQSGEGAPRDFDCPVVEAPAADGPAKATVRLWHEGTNRLVPSSGEGSAIRVRVLSPVPAYLAALGALLMLIAVPYVFFPASAKDETGRPVSAWYALLAEASGGYSLARVQLLIWFAPALAMYAAMSLPLHAFAEIPPTLAVLLGLSGATTLLGTAANPAAGASTPVTRPAAPARASAAPFPPHPDEQPAAAATSTPTGVARPNLSDLVRDWQNQGDFSRYQYLLLALVGASLLVARFFDDFSFPRLPQEFVALVGASQATYLGTKAVKTARTDEAADTKRRPA